MPWEEEPDEWRAEMMCAIRHSDWQTWCGYVAVGPTHPYYGATWERLNQLEVHGGVTYCQYGGPTDVRAPMAVPHLWVGEPPEPPREDDYLYWIGFDCAHAWDYRPGAPHPFNGDRQQYRDLEYVKKQVIRLARQLAQAATEERRRCHHND